MIWLSLISIAIFVLSFYFRKQIDETLFLIGISFLFFGTYSFLSFFLRFPDEVNYVLLVFQTICWSTLLNFFISNLIGKKFLFWSSLAVPSSLVFALTSGILKFFSFSALISLVLLFEMLIILSILGKNILVISGILQLLGGLGLFNYFYFDLINFSPPSFLLEISFFLLFLGMMCLFGIPKDELRIERMSVRSFLFYLLASLSILIIILALGGEVHGIFAFVAFLACLTLVPFLIKRPEVFSWNFKLLTLISLLSLLFLEFFILTSIDLRAGVVRLDLNSFSIFELIILSTLNLIGAYFLRRTFILKES